MTPCFSRLNCASSMARAQAYRLRAYRQGVHEEALHLCKELIPAAVEVEVDLEILWYRGVLLPLVCFRPLILHQRRSRFRHRRNRSPTAPRVAPEHADTRNISTLSS